MRRRSRIGALVLSAILGVAVSGCEEPIIFVGDLPGIMRIFAGRPNDIGASVDSLARRTELHDPRGLAAGADGTVYIADSDNSRILAVSPAGRLRVVADAGDCDDSACLVEPWGIALAPDGALWIADLGAHLVFRLDLLTEVLERRAGTGVAGSSPDLTPALEAMLNAPAGIAVSSGGVVYFSERGGHRVRWIQPNNTIRTIAGTGEAGFSEGSPAINAMLNSPLGLAFRANLLYVADEQNNRVREINTAGGGIRTIAGNGIPAYEETDSVALIAKLNKPATVAITPSGDQLFIADAVNDRVRVVNLQSGRISRFAGTGDPIFNGEGLDAADTSLDGPGGLAIGTDGSLFIADTGHHIVWRTPLGF